MFWAMMALPGSRPVSGIERESEYEQGLDDLEEGEDGDDGE